MEVFKRGRDFAAWLGLVPYKIRAVVSSGYSPEVRWVQGEDEMTSAIIDSIVANDGSMHKRHRTGDSQRSLG